MYSIDIIRSSINLYFNLKKNNIIGKNRINYIQKTFNIHINTLYKWIKLYYDTNNNTFDFSKYKSFFKYNNKKINDVIENFILNSIDKNNNFNIKKIKIEIKNKFNISLSKSSIYFVLHSHNLTYKKLYVKNIPIDLDKINTFKKDLKNKINNVDNINNFVSYDEMSIYLNSVPYKGWSIKGKNCFVKTKNKTIFNKRFSLGMSIDINSNIDFTIKEKSLQGKDFNKFIKKINKKNNKVIFLDNASIHTNFLFKNDIINNKWNIIYNIPYHSHLNPIEYVFSLLRKKILNGNITYINELINIILSFKKKICKKHVSNIFNKCLNEIKSF
jgi:transposase